MDLVTPIYIYNPEKPDEPWPDDDVFIMLAGNGLFMCRQHGMFKSCVAMKKWPGELENHEEFLVPNYPKVPRGELEKVVGWFDAMAKSENCEAGGYIIYDEKTKRTSIVIPDQVATQSRRWHGSGSHPVGLDYENLSPLPKGQTIIGTIHSHVYMQAFSSVTDTNDETHKTGFHIVVGKLDHEPPDFHVEAVVDEERFDLDMEDVVKGYKKRRKDYPQEWHEKIKVEVTGWDWRKKKGKGKGKDHSHPLPGDDIPLYKRDVEQYSPHGQNYSGPNDWYHH
ncbi:MAG: Mov34/MPN/PAD-1 family protein [Candidatus Thorarchaeota archaeon]|jgi:proteasome lid subunit RPN8/RPN11